MIGISIYSDSIRAVRLSKNKKQLNLKQTAIQSLYRNDIIQGKVQNKEHVLDALIKIKEELNISETEEIFLGIPNGIAKLDNPTFSADKYDKEDILENISLLGNKNAFSIDFPFVSSNFKIEKEITTDTPTDSNGETIPQFDSMKKISYVAILKQVINDYTDLFIQAGLNIVCVEPNAIASLRYLRFEAPQPFLIVDIEFDYTSFIMFSEKFGAFLLNASDLGSKNLINEEIVDGQVVGANINNQTLNQMINKIKLAMEFYKKTAYKPEMESEAKIQQIVFLNNDYNYVIDAVLNNISDVNVLSAEEMLPAVLNPKITAKEIDFESLYLYYNAIVIASNDRTNAFSTNKYERNIEVNFLPEELHDNVIYNKTKTKLNKSLICMTIFSSLYLLSTIGLNFNNIYKVPDANKVTPDLKAQYEEAKKQDNNMKDNITKYNTIANNKKEISPLIDMIVLSKTPDISLTSFNINFKNKRAVIECISDNVSAPNVMLQNLKEKAPFVDSQVSNTQSKNGKTAFQVIIPLKK